MQVVRIKLSSANYETLERITKQMIDIIKRAGVKYSGPVPLPTKELIIPTRKSMSGGGTESYERWKMRIHKRLIDMNMDDRVLKHILRIEIPAEIEIEISLKEKE